MRRDNIHTMRVWRLAAAAVVGVVALCGCGAGGHSRPVDRHLINEGRRVFVTAGCGSCHTLSAAGTHGALGPNFDTSERLDRAQILVQLDSGTGGMPSFRGRLTRRQEEAVAAFLFAATHRRAR